MLVAAALAARTGEVWRWELGVVAAWFVALAIALPVVARQPRAAHLLQPEDMPAVWASAAVLVACAMLVATAPRAGPTRLAARLGWATVGAMVGVYLGVGRAAFDAYDLHPVSRHLAAVQQAGQPIAHADKYHGQFQFIGRLREPLVALPQRDAVLDWARRHPDGRVVLYSYAPLRHADGRSAEFQQRFKGRYVSVWRAAELQALSDGWARDRDGDER